MSVSPQAINESLSHNREVIFSDVRSPTQRLLAWLEEDVKHVGGVVAGMMMMQLAIPVLSEMLFLFSAALFGVYIRRPPKLPFRVPLHAKAMDPTQRHPGSGRPQQGAGIIYLGNECVTEYELWVTNSDARTHMLIYGSTGSGKTFFLTGLAVNSLISGSGYCYIDGKADNDLWARKSAIARHFGREDDILLINFMTGGKDNVEPSATRMTNTTNPFSTAGAFALAQFVTNLMSDGGDGGSSDMWKGRAINYVDALLRILVYKRDKMKVPLSVREFRRTFTLEKTEELAFEDLKLDPRTYEKVQEPLRSYVENLPGYKKIPPGSVDKKTGKKEQQSATVADQHGYISMQLTRAAGMLTDTYGHMIECDRGEVDWHDLIINRRLLVVLLPTLEKSPEETQALGKIIVSMLKSVLATIMGVEVEGEYLDIVETKPTRSDSPFLTVMDEYGYYSVKGFANIVAQARSLGLQLVFASQDHPSLQKSSKEEAEAVVANCNIKIAGRLEDPRETFDVIKLSAGQVTMAVHDHLAGKEGGISTSFQDDFQRNYREVDRLTFNQLKGLDQGEFYFLFQNTLVKGKGITVLVPNMRTLRVNKFVQVMPPELTEIEALLDAETPPPPPALPAKEIWAAMSKWVADDEARPSFQDQYDSVKAMGMQPEEWGMALAALLAREQTATVGRATGGGPDRAAPATESGDPNEAGPDRGASPTRDPGIDTGRLDISRDAWDESPGSQPDLGTPQDIQRMSEMQARELETQRAPPSAAHGVAAQLFPSGAGTEEAGGQDADEGGQAGVASALTPAPATRALADMINDIDPGAASGADETGHATPDSPELVAQGLRVLQRQLEGGDPSADNFVTELIETIAEESGYQPEHYLSKADADREEGGTGTETKKRVHEALRNLSGA